MAVKVSSKSADKSGNWIVDDASVMTLYKPDASSNLDVQIAAIEAVQGIGDDLRAQMIVNARKAASLDEVGLDVALVVGGLDSKGKRLPDLIKIGDTRRGLPATAVLAIVEYADQIRAWWAAVNAE